MSTLIHFHYKYENNLNPDEHFSSIPKLISICNNPSENHDHWSLQARKADCQFVLRNNAMNEEQQWRKVRKHSCENSESSVSTSLCLVTQKLQGGVDAGLTAPL